MGIFLNDSLYPSPRPFVLGVSLHSTRFFLFLHFTFAENLIFNFRLVKVANLRGMFTVLKQWVVLAGHSTR